MRLPWGLYDLDVVLIEERIKGVAHQERLKEFESQVPTTKNNGNVIYQQGQTTLPQVTQSSPSPLRSTSLLGRFLPLPVAIGCAVAIGLSGFVLWQLLPKSSTSPPTSETALSQDGGTAIVPLPTMVCAEPAIQRISDNPIFEQEETKFYGQLVNGTGRGTAIFRSGFRYDGDFQNWQRQGCGRVLYPTNDPIQEYIGQFQADFPNGLGTLVFSNGEKYVGQVKTEQGTLYCQGEGVLILPEGKRIGGTWEKNKHQESQGKYSCGVALPN